MTTLQLNQEVLRQVGSISNNENLLKKVIDFIKSIAPAKEERVLGKKEQLENILSMSKTRDLSEEEIASEIEKGRQEFYDNRVKQ
jgi:hypothetical protein